MKRIILLLSALPLLACGMSEPVKTALYDKDGVTGTAPTYNAQATFDGMPRPTITPEDIAEQQQIADDLMDHTPVLQ